jgi:hypothetical protein
MIMMRKNVNTHVLEDDSIIMRRLKRYKKAFDADVKEKGLMFTIPNLFVTFSGRLVHPLDVLFGMDGLLDQLDKNNPFSAPIGFVVGAITGITGYVIALVIRGITIIPAFAGSVVDNLISRIFPSYKDLMAKTTMKLDSWGFRTPTAMTGGFGFLAGIIPEICVNLVHQSVGIVISVVSLITDSFNDGLRSIGRALFSRKKTKPTEDDGTELAAPSSTLHVHGQFAEHQHGHGHKHHHTRHSLQSVDVASTTMTGEEESCTAKPTSGELSPSFRSQLGVNGGESGELDSGVHGDDYVTQHHTHYGM